MWKDGPKEAQMDKIEVRLTWHFIIRSYSSSFPIWFHCYRVGTHTVVYQMRIFWQVLTTSWSSLFQTKLQMNSFQTCYFIMSSFLGGLRTSKLQEKASHMQVQSTHVRIILIHAGYSSQTSDTPCPLFTPPPATRKVYWGRNSPSLEFFLLLITRRD